MKVVEKPSTVTKLVDSLGIIEPVPIRPGTKRWDKRFEIIDKVELVELNEEKAQDWEEKYSARNARYLEMFRSGEREAKELRRLPRYKKPA